MSAVAEILEDGRLSFRDSDNRGARDFSRDFAGHVLGGRPGASPLNSAYLSRSLAS